MAALKAMSAARLAKFVKENPALAKAVASMAQPNSPLRLYALDPKFTDGYETALSVNVTSAVGLTLGELRQAVSADIARLPGVRALATRLVRLPAGKALRVSWNVPFTVNGLHQRIATLEYGLLHRGRVYFLQYTTGVPLLADLMPTFAASARSISFA